MFNFVLLLQKRGLTSYGLFFHFDSLFHSFRCNWDTKTLICKVHAQKNLLCSNKYHCYIQSKIEKLLPEFRPKVCTILGFWWITGSDQNSGIGRLVAHPFTLKKNKQFSYYLQVLRSLRKEKLILKVKHCPFKELPF